MEVIEGYSVLITDNEHSSRGTGTLFYSLEDPKHFYIFTCAHVIDKAEKVTIRMLLPTDSDPEEITVEANKNQFIFSPIDEVSNNSDQRIQTLDIGVIQCEIGDLVLQPTKFFLFPMSAGEKVVSKGYPGYPTEDIYLYYQQDSLEAIVDKVLNNEKYFLIRVNDAFLNHADREAELKGFSGSSIWDEANLRGEIFLCGGLISSAVDYNVSRGRIKVIHANYLRELMLQKFGITIEMRIPTVPDSDIAPASQSKMITIDRGIVRDSWIENERNKAKTYVNALQLKKAILTIDKVIKNTEFNDCLIEQKYEIYAIKLQAYRLAREFNTYDRIKTEMHQAGISNEREVFIDAVRYFESLDLQKAEEFIKQAIELNPQGIKEKVYDLAIHAINNDDKISIFSIIIDDDDRLLIETKDKEEESIIYQVLGYVFSTKYHETHRAIRCLNRAYQISNNFIILETLAVTYYLHSIRNAYVDDAHQRVDPSRIDKVEIDKARDVFLRVISIADETWLKGTIVRVGLLMFKCFYFMHDNFRVSKHYHELMKYYEFHNKEEKRDIQCCYLDIVCEFEDININDYDALNEYDKKFYGLLLLLNKPRKSFNHSIKNQIPIDQNKLAEIMQKGESILQELIELRRNEEKSRYDGIHSAFINLYGNAIMQFNWNVMNNIKRHLKEINNPRVKETIEIYINELQSTNEQEIQKQYIELFEKYNDIEAFYKLCNFYLRHQKPQKAKELYESVFREREYLITDWPEYFYRDYIGFIIDHKFNLFPALKCYIEKRNEFKDNIVYLSYEMEFRFSTCNFNDPAKMLEYAERLFDEGLYNRKAYNEKCLIINMLNCKPLEAEKYAVWKRGEHVYPLSVYEQTLNIWLYEKNYASCKVNMAKPLIDLKFIIYYWEKWLTNPEIILNRCNTKYNRIIVLDYCTLAHLQMKNKLDFINLFKNIYITHHTIHILLEEIRSANNAHARKLIEYLRCNNKVIFWSPTLEQQLEIRTANSDYPEVFSVCLLAIHMNCPALVGDSSLEIPDKIKTNVIRPNAIDIIIDYLKN